MKMMQKKLANYVARFNENDEEVYKQLVPNSEAEAFLQSQIPLLDCPDPHLEEIYYFRWWTFRKHLKQTDFGCIFTEFLPSVKWAGPFNSIVCPAGFHIREGRWLKDAEIYVKDYMNFWLDGHGDALKYSTWLPAAVLEYCERTGDFAYGVQALPKLVSFYETREASKLRASGLYWSDDRRDGMEYSVSGPGLRPTINAYAWADATAISKLAALAGDEKLAKAYREKANSVFEKTQALLWDGDFYRTIPQAEEENNAFAARPAVSPEHCARELVGYVPWYFRMAPDDEKANAFSQLLTTEGFRAPYGPTTCERRHPRFMEAFSHECLWNGPVWPFATSQVLVAASNLLRFYHQSAFTKDDYYALLLQYAMSQHFIRADKKRVPFIDENQDPFTGVWLARSHLEAQGWLEKKGGYERGKDYNHSLFCDLVLSGLLGIGAKDGHLTCEPLIPETWDWFAVCNLFYKGKVYEIVYDRDGEHYHRGAGLHVTCREA